MILPSKTLILIYSFVYGIIFWQAQKGNLPPQLPSICVFFFCALATLWLRITSKAAEHNVKPWLFAFTFALPILGAPTYFTKFSENPELSLLRYFGFLIVVLIFYLSGTFAADLIV